MSCPSSAPAARSRSRPTARPCPSRRVSADAGDWIHWSGDGRTLYWSQGPNLYGLNIGTSGAFAGGKLAAAPLVAELGIVASQAKPTGSIALTGARIVTMKGDEVIENGTILIEGDRIAAVGPTAASPTPPARGPSTSAARRSSPA